MGVYVSIYFCVPLSVSAYIARKQKPTMFKLSALARLIFLYRSCLV